MIRERVTIRGVLRPLEPESEIPALKLPIDHLGRINVGVARRYLTGRDLWSKKFGKTAKKIETKRMKNLQLARCETIRTVETLVCKYSHPETKWLTFHYDCLGPITGAPLWRA